jgi:hypothetical protein
MKPLSKEHFEAFERLYLRLEPENLTCDGEASRTEVMHRERQIKREWKALEAQVGHKVPYDQIEQLIWDHWRKRA